jgi:aspartate/methionine/tyrosine aminotransferase
MPDTTTSSRICDRVRAMPRAAIRVIFDAAQNYQDVIHLEIGQPDAVTCAAICDAAKRAMDAGATKYTPNAGSLDLRRAICQCRAAQAGPITPAEVVVTTGGMGALASTFAALLNAGDEVLLPDPGWPNYAMQIICAGGQPVYYGLSPDRGFAPQIEELESLVTPRTKVLVVNTPSNPTGAVFSPQTVAAILAFSRRHDLLIVSDEVYEDLVFDGPHVSFLRPDTRDKVVAIYSFSKTYAMTGWRVGYVIATEEIAEQISKLQEVYYACASSISQAAALAALSLDGRWVGQMRESYRKRRDILCAELSRQGVEHFLPQGAFYCLVSIGNRRTAMEFALQLLDRHGVAVAPGETFGVQSKNMVRVCFAAPEEDVRTGSCLLAEFVRNE